MTEFRPKSIGTVTVEDYVQVDYFLYKMDKEGIYTSPNDLYWKGNTDVYYSMHKKDLPLTWKEVCVIVDVSLTGRLYKKTEIKDEGS